MSDLYFPVCALIIAVTVNIIFFSKRRVKNVETKMYSYYIILTAVNAFASCIAVVCKNMFGFSNITMYLVKINYIFSLLIVWILFIYIINLAFGGGKISIKLRVFTLIYNVIASLAILGFDLNIVEIKNQSLLVGTSTYALYLSCIIYTMSIVVVIFSALLRNKDAKFKKFFPLFLLMFLIVFSSSMRLIIPTINLEAMIFAYIALIMFFTIKNPDVGVVEKLAIAKEQVERSNDVKRDFLSNVSHEIRTPLNAIVGLSQNLQYAETLDEAKEDARDIMISSNVLLDIIGGVLDISKIETSNLDIVKADYDFYEMIDEVKRIVNAKIGERPIQFTCLVNPDIPKILYGDKKRLKQCILNVMTNAVKYTATGFINLRITCNFNQSICELAIIVEDSGIGIMESKIDKLFSKFERLDDDYSTVEGVGLGLAITKQLLDMMRGSIDVDSVYGKGSKFTIRLNQEFGSMEQLEQSFDAKENFLKGKKILIVDDNQINLKVASRLLEREEAIIDKALSGDECLSKIVGGSSYDLILLDIMMPKLDGVQTLKLLRKIENFRIPVVALTADAVEGMRERYLSLGFDEYVPKPVDRSFLKTTLKKFLS